MNNSLTDATQWSCRHHKRRIVQPAFARAVAQRLSPTGFLYLSSDVHEVAVDMRRQFEEHAGDLLEVSAAHDQLPTWDRAKVFSCSPAPGAATQQTAAQGSPSPPVATQQLSGAQGRPSPAAESPVQQEEPQSAWAAKQWLAVNPIGLVTEREQWVLSQGLPMFRMLLSRKAVV